MRADRTLASEREGRLLQVLRRCAAEGKKCPTNGELCQLLGMESVGATSGVLSRLERRGLIAVERGQTSRVVTIIETGDRTAGVVGSTHWRLKPGAKPARPARQRIAKEQPAEIIDENLPRVERDPCFLCGARGDIGCRHRSAA